MSQRAAFILVVLGTAVATLLLLATLRAMASDPYRPGGASTSIPMERP